MARLKRSASNKELRGGYTTGACAAAAARAAVRCLLSQQPVSEIEIQLPNREFVSFAIASLSGSSHVTAGVIKDAGDDPDCTHGLEIQCTASLSGQPGIQIRGGSGVATVTLEGLELAVGEPAINPVPRQNIIDMAMLEWQPSAAAQQGSLGLELTISVPGGEQAAKQTINQRLGLIGGISILGTRGTVKPFSTSAFAASVRQAIQLAKTHQAAHVILTTGSRSEQAAMQQFPDLASLAFIQAGDFIGVGLRAAKRYRVKKVTIVAMIGKMAKLVSGRMMTHVSGHAIDFESLSELAKQSGLELALSEQIAKANTARQMLELIRDEYPQQFLKLPFFLRMCQQAQQHAQQYTAQQLRIELMLIDFDGRPLGHTEPFKKFKVVKESRPMDRMQQMTARGHEIENDSFAIIDREIAQIHGGHSFSDSQWPVVRRAIHTTGDFEFAQLFKFSADAIVSGVNALKQGCPIVSDVSMISSGISEQRLSVYQNQVYCFISDKGVITSAKQHGDTRAVWAMRKARDLGLLDGAIIAIGNAPTALFEVLDLVEKGEIKPALVIGIPVGFVKAAESKQALIEQDQVPYIASVGSKGGSPIVVSAVHALLYQSV
ncbi:cobalt-precorrin-5B (C(1))-methyltransferase [Agarivorans sp. QJM3NY_29]|uniref:cobalt-precorrin-5B (C(1))-methyltransferase n=1 Tax=unclassified Agarivorans TaxID=2636026 RepID=UPI003D7D5F12